MIVLISLDDGGGGGASVVVSLGGACPSDDGLGAGGFFVVEGAWGVGDVETTGGGVDVVEGEGFGGSELCLGEADRLGDGEGEGEGVGVAVGVLDSESVAAAATSSLVGVCCRCCIAFTSRTSILRLLKVASATESAESPMTSRSRSRLECIVARFGRGY